MLHFNTVAYSFPFSVVKRKSCEVKYVLREIGSWLKVNNEAIYDAQIWRKAAEGPTEIVEGQFSDGIKKNFTSQDFRFTTANGKLYATV